MYYPTLEQVKRLSETAATEEQAVGGVGGAGRPLLPLYTDILADMETPVSAYCKTALRPYSFLLESVSGGEQVARYSFIGIDPYMVMIHRGETALVHTMVNGEQGPTRTSSEEVPCHDPLAFIEAELGQYRLVTANSKEQDALPIFHG